MDDGALFCLLTLHWSDHDNLWFHWTMKYCPTFLATISWHTSNLSSEKSCVRQCDMNWVGQNTHTLGQEKTLLYVSVCKGKVQKNKKKLVEISTKGRFQKKKKKKIWNFPDLVGGWVWKSQFSRFKKIKKYALKMHKNA